MKARMMGVRSGHASMRDTAVVGHCDCVPEVGSKFCMSAPSRSGIGKVVATGSVVSVRQRGGLFDFETRNGHYRLEILDDDVICA